MGSVTLKDLAAKLGLSITTVSRALAGYSDVAEATRQRVLAASRQVGRDLFQYRLTPDEEPRPLLAELGVRLGLQLH